MEEKCYLAGSAMPEKIVETSHFNVMFILTGKRGIFKGLRETQGQLDSRGRTDFVSRFKLLGATTPSAGDGSASVFVTPVSRCQLCQPIFSTGTSVSPPNMHCYPTRLLHNFTVTFLLSLHVSLGSPGLWEPSWNSSSPSFPLARIFD